MITEIKVNHSATGYVELTDLEIREALYPLLVAKLNHARSRTPIHADIPDFKERDLARFKFDWSQRTSDDITGQTLRCFAHFKVNL